MYRPTGEREREREREKEKRHKRVWKSLDLSTSFINGRVVCVDERQKKEKKSPSIHPSGLLESSQMPIEIPFWEPISGLLTSTHRQHRQ
jgi:hypothetical protein